MDLKFDQVLGALLGSGAAAACAKYYISKALADLDTVMDKVNAINTELGRIAVKLDVVERDRERIENKIEAVEHMIYGSQSISKRKMP